MRSIETISPRPPRTLSNTTTHRFRDGFNGYLFVVHGEARVSTEGDAGELDEGGVAKIEGEREVTIRAGDVGAEALLVETRVVDR